APPRAPEAPPRLRGAAAPPAEAESRPAVVREQVVGSSDVKKIERRTPDIATRVRKKPPAPEVPTAKAGRGGGTGVLVAIAVLVIALAAAALYFGGVLG
ncbi:MAG: hypothetical protein ACUVYA_15350, partial [Planctomycetota bacterium]